MLGQGHPATLKDVTKQIVQIFESLFSPHAASLEAQWPNVRMAIAWRPPNNARKWRNGAPSPTSGLIHLRAAYKKWTALRTRLLNWLLEGAPPPNYQDVREIILKTTRFGN